MRLFRPVLLMLSLWTGVLCLPCFALPLKFKSSWASYEPTDGHGRAWEAVDGSLQADNGWRLDGGQFREQSAIFVLDKPLTASIYQMQLSCLSPIPRSHPACFVISVTTDPNPSKKSTWTPLIPNFGILNDFSQVEQGSIDFHGGRVLIRLHEKPTVLTLRAPAPVGNVTAFRLQLLPIDFNPKDKVPPSIGCSEEGSVTITELSIESDPLQTTNIAMGRQVRCSGPIVNYLPPHYLTDGLGSTFTHPQNFEGDEFHFDLDLGSDMDLDHIVVRGRNDGVSPERLSNYRVQLLRDADKSVGWSATLHADGSNPGVGGADRIEAIKGSGVFRGRYLRIGNHPGQPHCPQIAELEVYPSLHPRINDWIVDGASVTPDPELNVSSDKKRINFTIHSKEVAAVRDLIRYRWKVVGLSDVWQETDASGIAYLSPLPPVGHYRIVAQAQHTDGSWDQSEANIALSVTLPWWQRPGSLVVLLVAGGMIAWGIWWRISVGRMRTQLARAQERIGLNRERLRIARDMHDDMGARLTSLALLADRCRRTGNTEVLESLAREARNAVESLDEIVWSVNPRHDTVGSLSDHLQEHAANYLNNAGIRCFLERDLAMPEQPLGLTERHHLLMAAKEALQNIVKHSQASEVHMDLCQKESVLTVEIRDNGKGLSMASAKSMGDGLANMRQRLEEAGGSSKITSSPQAGTIVHFQLPLKPVS